MIQVFRNRVRTDNENFVSQDSMVFEGQGAEAEAEAQGYISELQVGRITSRFVYAIASPLPVIAAQSWTQAEMDEFCAPTPEEVYEVRQGLR